MRFEMPEDPEAQIDVTKRYDVYCGHNNREKIVYRNVLFKGLKGLFPVSAYDIMGLYFELEHASGQRIFISRGGVTGFCEHGKELGGEPVHEP